MRTFELVRAMYRALGVITFSASVPLAIASLLKDITSS
jgi:hypothetical protein